VGLFCNITGTLFPTLRTLKEAMVVEVAATAVAMVVEVAATAVMATAVTKVEAATAAVEVVAVVSDRFRIRRRFVWHQIRLSL